MSAKTEIIALAVRLLAENTNLVRKPAPFESLVSEFFGNESYDRQMARNIESELDRASAAVKRVNTRRKFKKITAHV